MLTVSVTAFALLQAMVIPVLPTIQEALATDARGVASVVSLYLASAAVATPIMGRLGDAHGKRRILVLLLLLLSAGSLIAAVAPSLPVMVLGRIVQGVGGGVMPLAVGIARDVFPAERAGAAVGGLAAISGIGASLGLVLAGPVVDLLGYHALFLAPMVITLATAVAAMVVVPPSPAHRGSPAISWWPAPFLCVTLAAFVVATTHATDFGWTDRRTVGLYAVSVVSGYVWVRLERLVRHPLIDLAMMRIPAVRSANVVCFLHGFVMFGVYTYVPQLLQAPTSTGYGFGASITTSGLAMVPMATAVFVGSLITNRAVRRFDVRPVVTCATVVMTLCLAVIVFSHEVMWQLAVILGVYGVALGVNMASLATLVVTSVPSTQSAVASGVHFNLRNMGGAIGAAVMATVVTANIGATGDPLEGGYVTGFVVLTLTCALATVLSASIPKPPPAGGA